MNEKIYILKSFEQPIEIKIVLHSEGLDYISNHLTQDVIPGIDDILGLVKQYLLTKNSDENSLYFVDIIEIESIKDSYINNLSSEAKSFVYEMNNFVTDFMKIYLINGVNDIYELPGEFSGAIDYLEYKISNSNLSSQEKDALVYGVEILRSSYNYWTNIFTSQTNSWKTWWTSVNYNISDVRSYSNNGDWIISSISAAIAGCQVGEIYNLSGWGSIASSLFAASICAIFPNPILT
jgi:hypothetical protein